MCAGLTSGTLVSLDIQVKRDIHILGERRPHASSVLGGVFTGTSTNPLLFVGTEGLFLELRINQFGACILQVSGDVPIRGIILGKSMTICRYYSWT